jgi:CHAT domain
VEYLDFDLEAVPLADGEYRVKVLDSPGGQDDATMRLPFDVGVLRERIEALQAAILQPVAARRTVSTPPPSAAQSIGTELWQALFSETIVSRFDVSRAQARDQQRGIRIKLRFSSPELASLPWEFLYDERRGDYLALSESTPIVRFVEIPEIMKPLLVTPPLRILGLIVGPTDMAPLRVEVEKQQLERALGGLISKGLVELHWVTGQTRRDLGRELRDGPWHIFHFIGHGGFDESTGEGVLVLADEQGRSRWIPASDIGRMLGEHDQLRLVVLNSCDGARGSQADVFSSTSAAIVRDGTPAVVAMQYEITDKAALEFSRSFYEAIADGLPVDASVAAGRDGIAGEISGSLEWGTPVLFTRAPDGVLFAPTPSAARATAGPARGIVERLGGRQMVAAVSLAVVVTVIAIGLLAVQALSPRVVVPPAVAVSVEEVHPGDTLMVSGTGFSAGEPVQISIADLLLGLATAKGDGSFDATVLIPNEVTRTGARSRAIQTVAEGRISKIVATRLITVSPGPPEVFVSAAPSTSPSPSAGPLPTDLATSLPSATPDGTPIPAVVPPRCIAGFVWREAFDGDFVCVTPDEREQVAQDNAVAAVRVDPTGQLGPDTCIVPYVWREADIGDHVCVTVAERERVRADNEASPDRTAP